MIVSEFGGVSLAGEKTWGYGVVTTHEAYAEILEELFGAVNEAPAEHLRYPLWHGLRKSAVDVLILDDFALKPLDATQTSDFYEFVVERHRKASTIWVSNREPSEWLTMTTDALLAQSAVDRLTSGAHHLIIEGPSYRQRSRAPLDTESEIRNAR